MSGKAKTIYCCTECGYETGKWLGKCPACGSWNSLQEQEVAAPVASAARSRGERPAAKAAPYAPLDQILSGEEIRYITGIEELDRVLGGGIVPGSVVLLSGDPGIGKSTILMQMCGPLSQQMRILYVTGEESARQIKLRALRLGVDGDNLLICACTDIDQVAAAIEQSQPQLIVVDSIQTMVCPGLSSYAGSVTQVREAAQRLIVLAKQRETPLFLVGHVNKDGAIAGPKVLEHIVDCVLYFEGERQLPYRILRAVKNRYGSTNEIGVFEMGDAGLNQVPNPSVLLLSDRPSHLSGTCVACVMEGSRPILTEVQALLSKSSYAAPRRTATGFDFNRMAMLLAVLEKRCGFSFGALDAYVNVVGGLRLDEPAADLPVALALVSNLTGAVIDEKTAAVGEVGLAGEVRAIGHLPARIREAYRLGFRRILLPRQSLQRMAPLSLEGLELVGVRSVGEAAQMLG